MNKLPSILLIGNHLLGSSTNQNVWHELATHLKSSGYDVITTSHVQNKLLRLADMLWAIWHQRNHYQLAQIDVFSGQAFTWAYLSGGLLQKLKKPFILTLHGGNLPEFAKKHPGRVQWLLGQAAGVTAPSSYLLQAMRVYRKDLRLIPNALDISSYFYKEHFYPEPKLIWLRAFHKIYNPRMAIESVALLRNQFSQLSLTMIGPDKGDGSFQKTQELADNLNLRSSVSFPGNVSKAEVPIWLTKGDIFLNTTYFDNTPISVMEAMACGLCVISTNVGGIPYLIDDGVDALLVPPNDPDAMAAAVKRILSEPGLAERLSKNARKKAEQFDWSIILPQWERLIEEVIEN